MNTKIVALARSITRARRKRDAIFGELFADPAWDILLDLFVADAAGCTTMVSDACRAAAAPSTTALRHISVLENAELIVRHGDLHDGRIKLVRLTQVGREKMVSALSAYMSKI